MVLLGCWLKPSFFRYLQVRTVSPITMLHSSPPPRVFWKQFAVAQSFPGTSSQYRRNQHRQTASPLHISQFLTDPFFHTFLLLPLRSQLPFVPYPWALSSVCKRICLWSRFFLRGWHSCNQSRRNDRKHSKVSTSLFAQFTWTKQNSCNMLQTCSKGNPEPEHTWSSVSTLQCLWLDRTKMFQASSMKNSKTKRPKQF